MATRPCYFCQGKGRRRLRRRARGRGRGSCYGPCHVCCGTGQRKEYGSPQVPLTFIIDEATPEGLRTFFYGNSP